MIKINNNAIEIRFSYDPGLVAAVKMLPNRWFDGNSKAWFVPLSPGHAKAVTEFADRYKLAVDPAIAEIQSAETPNPRRATVNSDRVSVSFPFDPDLVEAIRKLGFGTWDKKTKTWQFPTSATALAGLSRFLAQHKFAGIEDVDAMKAAAHESARAAIEASQAHDAEFCVEGLGGELMPFQRAGAKYASERKRVIIGDEMGLGKTVQAIATLQALQAFPALILCPYTLKRVWVDHVRQWLPDKNIQVLGPTGFGRADAPIAICNYDQLKNYRDFLARREFKGLVCDESQALKGAKTQRTIYTEEIALGVIYQDRGKKLDRRYKDVTRDPIPNVLLLTGTPMLNDPMEWVPQLRILSRLQEFGGSFKFYNRYGGGANLTELNTRLRSTCYIRRLKADVLKELPAKRRALVPFEITNRREYQHAEDDLIGWLIANADDGKAERASKAEQLAKIEALKQLAVKGKMAAVLQWAADFEDKLVLFAWHKDAVRELARELQCRYIDGSTSEEARAEAVRDFQENPTTRRIVLNIKTGGTGLTLHAASNVAFVELGWNPGTMDQAEDRVHRIGQTDSVTAWWLLAAQTIEDRIYKIIEGKRVAVTAATDGIEIEDSSSSVLAELVKQLRSQAQPKPVIHSQQKQKTFELF